MAKIIMTKKKIKDMAYRLCPTIRGQNDVDQWNHHYNTLQYYSNNEATLLEIDDAIDKLVKKLPLVQQEEIRKDIKIQTSASETSLLIKTSGLKELL